MAVTRQQIRSLPGQRLDGEAETRNRIPSFRSFFQQGETTRLVFLNALAFNVKIRRAQRAVHLLDIFAPLILCERGFQVLFDVFLEVSQREIRAVFFGLDRLFQPFPAFFLIAQGFIATQQARSQRRHRPGIAETSRLCVVGVCLLGVLQFRKTKLAFIKTRNQQQRRDVPRIRRALPPENRLIRVRCRCETTAQIRFAQNPGRHRWIILRRSFQSFARLIPLVLFLRTQQNKRHPVNRILVLQRCCLPIKLKRLILRRFCALAGLVRKSHQIQSLGISRLSQRCRKLDSLRVTSRLKGIHRFFCRPFHRGRHCGGTV